MLDCSARSSGCACFDNRAQHEPGAGPWPSEGERAVTQSVTVARQQNTTSLALATQAGSAEVPPPRLSESSVETGRLHTPVHALQRHHARLGPLGQILVCTVENALRAATPAEPESP